MTDTIAAIATAPGLGGIGIVRLSGPDSFELADKVFKGKHRSVKRSPSHSLSLGWVMDPDSGHMIDEALVAVMRGPKTYTGDDVVEFQCHGGRSVLKSVLELVLRMGARAAEPGEFTKRAFLSGRIDLAQAEAVLDLVNARSEEALKVALRQAQGELSDRVARLRSGMISILAHIAAAVDFCEEIEEPSREETASSLERVIDQVRRLLVSYQTGRVMRDGLRVAILGKPNVGKSSLLNVLLGVDRAIVSETPGTTRDVIEETVNINGIPLVIVDTAGIRPTDDSIERQGVKRSAEALEIADVALVVLDDAGGIGDEDLEVISMTEGRPRVLVINKSDLEVRAIDEVRMGELAPGSLVRVSALTGCNLHELKKKLVEVALPQGLDSEVLVSNSRHGKALEGCEQALTSALTDVKKDVPLDIVALDVERALRSVGQITGESLSEDLLDELFSQFCVGK